MSNFLGSRVVSRNIVALDPLTRPREIDLSVKLNMRVVKKAPVWPFNANNYLQKKITLTFTNQMTFLCHYKRKNIN